jgi:hypothetical protein
MLAVRTGSFLNAKLKTPLDCLKPQSARTGTIQTL